MYYGSTQKATDWTYKSTKSWRARLFCTIFFFIPRANPNNEKLYYLVKKWLLELDENGQPQREIALDANELPLFCSPTETDFGLWTDSNNLFQKNDIDPISKEFFEATWKVINPPN
jgi:hypothetical protein